MKLERPDSGQFARDGAWEQAWAFDAASIPDEPMVRAYAHGRRELAFEAFFGDVFFGIRHEGPEPAVEAFALRCVQAWRRTAQGGDFVAHLSRALGVDGLRTTPAFAEIGAVNAWRSVGAFRIDDPRGALDMDGLWSALMAAPVAADRRHRKALELAYRTPLSHWLGLPVSDDAPPHAISRAKLEAALRDFAQGGPAAQGLSTPRR